MWVVGEWERVGGGRLVGARRGETGRVHRQAFVLDGPLEYRPPAIVARSRIVSLSLYLHSTPWELFGLTSTTSLRCRVAVAEGLPRSLPWQRTPGHL